MSIGMLAVVYGTVFRVSNFKEYTLYLGIGLATWNSIAASLTAAPYVFKNNSGKITNTPLHPVFYICEEWAFQTQSFAQSFGLIVLVLGIIEPKILANLLTHGILPIGEMLILLYWLPALISVIAAKYEDFAQFVPIVIQLAFLISPILYKKESLGEWSWLTKLNPLYLCLEFVRASIIDARTSLNGIVVFTLFNIAGMVITWGTISRIKKKLPFWL